MLFRALWAESLKYRRTPALWLALGVPLLLALLMLLIALLRPQPGPRHWDVLAGNLFMLWALLVLPLGLAILTALATGLEHAEHHLKQVLVLPPPRWTLYVAKLVAGLSLAVLGTVVLVLGYAGVGVLLHCSGPVPWGSGLRTAFLALAAALPLIHLGVWLGLPLPSMVVPMSVGAGGAILSTLAYRSEYWLYLPWTYPVLTVLPGSPPLSLILTLSAALSLLLLVLGLLHFIRRDIL